MRARMDISSEKVLVTGAGGFIGSHLVEALLREGCDIRAFVHYNSSNNYGFLETLGPQLKDIEVVAGDLRDKDAVRRAVAECGIVFHLGALIGIPYSYLNPADAVATNVGGTLNVLDAARELNTEKVIVTSTSEVYGTPLYVPVDEKHPLQAQSPYAASKIAADKLAESYCLSYDLPVAIVRPFNTFGPRQSARAIVPTIAVQALCGDKIRIGSVTTQRDLLYVDDTVSAFLAVAAQDSAVGKVINFGTGGDVSIGELIEIILTILKKTATIIHDDERVRPAKSEIQRLVCNYSLAQDLLNWEPKVSLEDGLHSTLAWIREHLDYYKADIYNV